MEAEAALGAEGRERRTFSRAPCDAVRLCCVDGGSWPESARRLDVHTSASSPRRFPFAGFRHPRDVIALSVHWYLRYSLSFRNVEELLVERHICVDHVTIHAGSPVAPWPRCRRRPPRPSTG
jgi:hypothetical protein